LWVEFRNTGKQTWAVAGSHPVHLGTSNPLDRLSLFRNSSWFKDNRPAVLAEEVLPGSQGRFEFKISAPSSPGKYRESFSLVAEDLKWIPRTEVTWEITVNPLKLGAQWLNQSPPLEVVAGEESTVWVEFKNMGDLPWKNSGRGALKLGTARPLDRDSVFYHPSWLSKNRAASFEGEAVKPGEEVRFTFKIKAPSRAGLYKEYFRLVSEGIAWLPDIGLYWQFKVVPAVYSAKWVRQSENLSLSPEGIGQVWVEFKNTGNVAWSNKGANALKLGTARPLDRDSVFYHPSWLSKNRAASFEGEGVEPGEVARFVFTIKALSKLGTYKEYFRPVAEKITWLEDWGVYWEIKVEEELVIKNPIRIGLTYFYNPVTVSGSAFVVRKGDGKTLVRRASGSLTITPISGGYRLSTGETVTAYLRVIPLNKIILRVQGENLSSRYGRFRGILEFRRSSYSGRPWVINELELEDYLKGVAEVPNNWPLEAIKAQMVAARTYAMRLRQNPVADIFHLYDDTRSQVYYGYDYELAKPNIAKAAQETKGMVVKYQGQLARTYYFSDSGGYTENVENVWADGEISRAIPYLVGVADPYAKPITWEFLMTQQYIWDRFDDDFHKVLSQVEVVTNFVIDSRFPSGRVRQVTFTTASGKKLTISGRRFDYLTHNTYVRSLMFNVAKTGSASSPEFKLSGKGWGHGVGMPQWGAHNMAQAGRNYQEILRFYYTGVNVVPA